MMQHIKDYIEARDAIKRGEKESAELKLSRALGVPLTPYMKSNLEKLLDNNDAALTLVIAKEK